MTVTKYIDSLMESIGKPGVKFKYTVGGIENEYAVMDVAGEIILNVVGAGASITRWRGDGGVAAAQAEIDKVVARVGAARFNKVVADGIAKKAASANDTPWELYSEYNTVRGNPAFKVYKKIEGGVANWKQEGPKHLSIHRISKEDEVKKAIADENRFYKLKHVSGYNHKS